MEAAAPGKNHPLSEKPIDDCGNRAQRRATGVEEERQDVHDHVDGYELPDQGLGVASDDADQVVLPSGTEGADTAIRTARFISADQSAAVEAEEGFFFAVDMGCASRQG